jgi:hypothetical protein
MNLSHLVPQPTAFETFKRNRLIFVPDRPGCYVLCSFDRVVLYIGLSKDLRRRMNDHLDSRQKTQETPLGRAVFLYWLENPDLNKVERTWLNIHIQQEGALPILNSIYSPVSI